MANQNDSNRRSNGSQNSGKKNETTKKKGSTMDTDNLKFSMGKDQAKNHEELARHLTNTVQGKHGAPSAHTSLNGSDCDFPEMTMDTLETALKNETNANEAKRETQTLRTQKPESS